MASVNKTFHIGRLTRDPELRFTGSGQPVGNLGLAVNEKYKSGDDWKERVTFLDITVWGKQAENCAGYLNKGSNVHVEGRLETESWEGQDGQKKSKLVIVANNVQFLDKKPDSGEKDIPF